jgi:ribokinase
VLAAARLADACGARTVLNLSPPREIPAELLALCDPLVVNEHEAAFLLGGEGPVAEQAAALLGLGPRSVVVTLGAAGAYAAAPGVGTGVASPEVRVVDTTGAGDAFTGALAWRLALGDDLADATAFAVRVGAAAVRKQGAQSSYPSLAEVP